MEVFDEVIWMEIQSRLKVIFAERNIRQNVFAEKVGVSKTALNQLVNGSTLPTLKVAYRIAKELGLTVEGIWVEIE